MSGIVGIVRFDGTPVDDDLLQRLTAFQSFRGPDGQRTWFEGAAGLGHTLLRATDSEPDEIQPLTLDRRAWIVADARLDARRELIDRIETAERVTLPSPVSDVELIARAYRSWGESCVDHLLGDFAFGVWDAERRRLFLARDHMGVRMMYYARLGATVIFSNTIDCVRQHPLVTARLNDLAIADYLLLELNKDPATTSFADVRRVPPAHRATFSIDGERVERYWRLPIDEPIRYPRAGDYEERFREVVGIAVRDRLPSSGVGVFMSGGLDSGTLAAAACGALGGPAARNVRAFTTVWNEVDQNEQRYASLTAAFLGIPIEFRDLGSEPREAGYLWHGNTPEPLRDAASPDARYLRDVSARARVCFYGEGPDNALLYEWRAYLSYMWRRRERGCLVRDVVMHAVRHRRLPLLPTLPTILKRKVLGHDRPLSFPAWFNKNFDQRLGLRERWARLHETDAHAEAMRPVSHASFESPVWGAICRTWDAETTGAPLEVRHPYLDLRVLRYLLAVPTLPWCRAKLLVRRSMRGRLPRAVLERRKSPLIGDPLWEATRHGNLRHLQPMAILEPYVDARVVSAWGEDMAQLPVDLRAYKLGYWLQKMGLPGTSPMENA